MIRHRIIYINMLGIGPSMRMAASASGMLPMAAIDRSMENFSHQTIRASAAARLLSVHETASHVTDIPGSRKREKTTFC